MHFLDYSLFIFIIVNIFLVTNFKKIKFLHHILDKPDKKRKFHLKATPLAGGIILMINLFILRVYTAAQPSRKQKKTLKGRPLRVARSFLLVLRSFLLRPSVRAVGSRGSRALCPAALPLLPLPLRFLLGLLLRARVALALPSRSRLDASRLFLGCELGRALASAPCTAPSVVPLPFGSVDLLPP